MGQAKTHLMTTSAVVWAQAPRHGTGYSDGSLEDVGAMNYKAGVREEKWGMLDLKTLQFPKTTLQSVKRATLLQHFEADFVRAMGVISPAAATYSAFFPKRSPSLSSTG